MILFVDLVDTCNLKCSDCPVSIYRPDNPSYMGLGLFHELLTKVKREMPGLSTIRLYNWSEPLLHPHLAKFVNMAADFNLRCHISTNLAVREADLRGLMRSNPSLLIISVSGFTQAVYKRYHRGGNVEVVKSNLQQLLQLRAELGTTTKIQIRFLRFQDNLHEESLWREKGVSVRGSSAVAREVTTPQTATRFLTPQQDSPEELHPPGVKRCKQRNNIILDVQGDVYLCCAYWNYPGLRIGNYLDLSLKEIQALRSRHEACRYCGFCGNREGGMNPLPDNIMHP